jgi:hypothetical protein
MVGCAHTDFWGPIVPEGTGIEWPDAARLCGDRYRVASATNWRELRGETVPEYHYWTSTDLRWSGSEDDCSVVLADEGENPCSGGGPMRVCAPDDHDEVGNGHQDPLGNGCTWINCSHVDARDDVNEFFGGCSNSAAGGHLASTLCIGVPEITPIP